MTSLDWDRATRRVRQRLNKRSRPMSLVEVPAGASGFRGVHIDHEKGRYRAEIEIDGARFRLGRFRTAMAAAAAYDEAAIAAWGAAAITNFRVGADR